MRRTDAGADPNQAMENPQAFHGRVHVCFPTGTAEYGPSGVTRLPSGGPVRGSHTFWVRNSTPQRTVNKPGRPKRSCFWVAPAIDAGSPC